MVAPETPWWREGVIYHIYLRSFADGDGDGLGDLPGLIRRLDHLRGAEDSLGVDAIWISPCFPSPDRDFGYDVADYRAIDPRYGTLADFDRLLDEAHRRGLRVMLDLVFNHSSDQHPWFLESRASRDNPRRDWYLWRDPRPDGSPPNNWQSVFGGRAWEWDESTRQFYYHMFLKEQPDLNWRNPDVRRELMDTVRFWLDRGVDGFRLDVFSAWFKHANLPDNPPRFALRGFDRQHHIHDINQHEMLDALSELRRILDSYPERAAVGELFGRGAELAAGYCGPDRLHLVFNFIFTACGWRPAEFAHAIQDWDRAVAPEGWPCYVLGNHDVPRLATRYGGRHPDEVAKVAAALLLTQRGTPFLYYGDEIGMRDLPLRRNQLVDPPGKRYWPLYKGRDPSRGPMQWDSSVHAGFTSGTPWLPVHPDFINRNVAGQRRDPDSVFSFHRALLGLRRESPALRRGSYVPLLKLPGQALAFARVEANQSAVIALNFAGHPVDLRLDISPPDAAFRLALSTHAGAPARLVGRRIALQGHEAVVFLSG